MKLEKITDNIYAAIYDNRHGLAHAFQRIQERYECVNPEFHNRVFSKSSFNTWYKEFTDGGNYYDDWGGFNVPDFAFKSFLNGVMHPLDRHEKILLDEVKKLHGKFYIIGLHDDDPDFSDIVLHETAHGLFYTNDDYHEQVLTIMQSVELLELKKHLQTLGYSDNVLLDECHAYCLADSEYLKEQNLWNNHTEYMHHSLMLLFELTMPNFSQFNGLSL